jgi:hypothetical protein
MSRVWGREGVAVQAGRDDFNINFICRPQEIAGVSVGSLRRPGNNATGPGDAAFPHPSPDA